MNTHTPMSLMDFVKAAKENIKEISPEDLQQMRESVQDLLILDVRESSEHEQGHIEGALLVPRGILEAAADPKYPKHTPVLCSDQHQPVAIYCATGGRSAMAANTLQMMGFSNVVSVEGGFVRWSKENRPVEKSARYV